MNEQSIFAEALEQPNEADRAAYLDRVCAGNAELRARVETLLRAHEAASGFLGESPAAAVATLDEPMRECVGMEIGPYKLLQQLGEGGMGTVFLAKQSKPVERFVAVKVIKPGMDSRQVIARFEAERQALALMDHPNIARVLDAGTTESGRPYFVMELVKGMPITKYCDQQRLTPRQRLELFLPICHAIQHAHQKGIIHRDVKPSNVLVAQYDGKPVPKVIDFGVAKATGSQLTERTLFTAIGAVVGTFEYMSPEQAELNQLDVDTRTDIYSLGVLLYELLTGTTPLDRRRLGQFALLELLRVIREDEPPKPSTRVSTDEGSASIAANRGMEPSKLSGMIRGELDWIVMKALEKDRTRRYETANGFAMDVQRYLADEAVQACPPSLGYRLRKFTRRNRVALLTGAAIATSLVLGTAISIWQATVAWDAEGQAQQSLEAETHERKRAEEAEGSARQAAERLARQKRQTQIDYSTSLLDRALDLCDRDERAQGLLWMGRSLASAPADDADLQRVIRMNLAAYQSQIASLRGIGNAPGRIEKLGCSSDGKTFFMLTAAADYPSQLNLPADKEKVFEVERNAPGSAAVFDVGEELSTLRGEPLPHRGYPTAMAFSRDGKWVVTAIDHQTLQIWDARTLKAHGPPLVHPDTVLSATFSDDSSTLLTTSGPPTITNYRYRRWAWFTEEIESPLPNWGRTAHVWAPESGKPMGAPIQHPGPLTVVAISPDGQTALTASGNVARLWNAATGQQRDPPLPHDGLVTAAAFSPDGRFVITAGDAEPWKPSPGDNSDDPDLVSIRIQRRGANQPSAVAQRWEVATGTPAGEKLTPMRSPRLIVFSPDGNVVVTCGSSHTELWCVGHEYRMNWGGRRRLAQSGVVQAAAFSPDGRTLVTGSADTYTRAYDVATSAPLCSPLPQKQEVTALALHPYKHRVMTGDERGTIRSWNLSDARAFVTNLTNFLVESHVRVLEKGTVFSSDGRKLLATFAARSSSPAQVEVWDVTAKTSPELASQRTLCYTTLMGNDGSAIYLSPEHVAPKVLGHALVLASEPEAAAFSPDGQTALVSSRDGGLWQWRSGAWTAIRSPPQPTPASNSSGGAATDSRSDAHSEPTPADEPDAGTPATATDTKPEPGPSSVLVRRPKNPPAEDGTQPPPSDAQADTAGRENGAETNPQTQSPSGDGTKPDANQTPGAIQYREVSPADDTQHVVVVTAIAFGPDGKSALLGCRDGSAQLWDVETWQPLGQPFQHESAVLAAAVSPDGKLALSAAGNTAVLWKIETGEPIGTPMAHQAAINAIAISPDGRTVATAGSDATARLWSAATGEPLAPPLHHAGLQQLGKVSAVAFSPDGKSLLTAIGRFTRYWDVALGKPIGPALGDVGGDVAAVAFTSNPPGVTVCSSTMHWTLVRRRELTPPPAPGSIEQLRSWTEAITGQSLDAAGVAGWLTREERIDRDDRLKELGGKPLPPESPKRWHQREAEGCEADQFWASAVWHRDRLIEIEPAEWQHYFDRGRAYAAMKRHEEAITDYNRAIERGATGHDVWAYRGKSYAELGQWDRAADDYTRAADLGADWEVWCRRAEAHLKVDDVRGFQLACSGLLGHVRQTDDPLAAFFAVDTCLRGDFTDENPDDLLRLAELALAEAEAVEGRGCSGYWSEEVQEAVATVLYRAARYDETIGRLRRALDESRAKETKGPTPVNWLFLLALSHHRLGRGDEAKQWLEQAQASIASHTWTEQSPLRRDVREAFGVELPLTPPTPEPSSEKRGTTLPWEFYFSRGKAYVDAGRPEDAIDDFTQAIDAGADDPRLWYLRGNTYAELRRWQEAERDYREVISRQDDHAGAHFDLGIVLTNQNRHEEAAAAYRESIRHNPGNWGAHNNLGSILLDKQKNVDEAIAEFREAARLAPQQAMTHANLGHALRSKGELEEAVAAFQRAIEVDASFASAYLGLGSANIQLQRWDDAAAAFGELIRLEPTSYWAHRSLGSVRQNQGRLADAEAAYRGAVRIDPRSTDARYALAWVLRLQDKWEEALGEYRQVFRLSPDHPNVANALHSLARTLRDKGDWSAAETVQREALALRRSQMGDDHAATATEMHDLAFALMRNPDKRAEAEQLYRDALAVRRSALGEGDASTADTAFRLAQVLGDQGKFEEVETLFRQAHDGLMANPGSEGARRFEPVLVQWIIEQYRNWEMPDRAEEWAKKRRPTESDEEKNDPDPQNREPEGSK